MARKCIEERLAQIEVQRKLLKPVSANRSAGMMNATRSCWGPCPTSPRRGPLKRRGEWLRRGPPGYLTHHSNKDRFAGLLKALSEDPQA